jgi:hypothetical protein
MAPPKFPKDPNHEFNIKRPLRKFILENNIVIRRLIETRWISRPTLTRDINTPYLPFNTIEDVYFFMMAMRVAYPHVHVDLNQIISSDLIAELTGVKTCEEMAMEDIAANTHAADDATICSRLDRFRDEIAILQHQPNTTNENSAHSEDTGQAVWEA